MSRLRLLITAIVLFAFAACGGASHAPAPRPPANTGAQIEALACPEGVDSALWAELKEALEEALETELAESRPGSPARLLEANHGRDARATKITAAAPAGDANQIDDLTLAGNGDGTYTLTWRYRNLGDYDQNGVVALGDIYPLAEHFGEAVPETDSERNSLAAVIDGSGNSRIGIEEVTPIAQCFEREVAWYAIEGAGTSEGPWEAVGEVAQDAGSGDGRLEYAEIIESPAALWHRVVPYDSAGAPGEPSNAVLRPSNEPIIYEVTPTSGYQHEEFTFTATVSGQEPLSYAWDFGGGATPDASSAVFPTVTLSEAGEYEAVLTVTNAYGSADYPFTLTVNERDQWVHTWGGERADSAEALAIDEEGNIYVVGTTASFGAGHEDVLVLKYSPDGEVLWAKTWGTANPEYVAGCALVEGSLLVVGHAYGIGAGADDLFFLKYDLGGNLLWARTWGTPDYERARAIAVDAQENIYIAGEWLMYGGQSAVLVAKFTPQSDCVWASRWSSYGESFAMCCALASDSSFYVSARLEKTPSNFDTALLKYAAHGDVEWVKSWGGDENEWVSGTAETEKDEIWVTGTTRSTADGTSDLYLLRWTSNGDILSARTWGAGGSDIGGPILAYHRGVVYLAAETMSFGARAGMMLKYDHLGNLISRKLANPDGLQLVQFASDQSGNTYLCGASSSAEVSWSDVGGTVNDVELTSSAHNGTEFECVGTSATVEGVQTSPIGSVDVGGGGVDVMLLRNNI